MLIGLNGYNWGFERRQQSFHGLFSSAYKVYRKKFPYKPILIVETGSVENSAKANWVKNAFTSTEKYFPGIKGLCWWSECWKSKRGFKIDSRIDSSPKALQAFKQGTSNPYFLGKMPYRG
jgi:hypothetical protein